MNDLYNALFSGLVVTDSQKALLILFLFWFVITITCEMINAIRGLY